MAADSAPREFQGLPLVYEENFDAGIDKWQPTDAKAWSVIDENGNKAYALTGTSDYVPPVRSPLNISLIRELDLGDFVIEARIKQTGREYGHRDACIFFGHNDPSHFYYVHIASKADPHAHSIFIVNGEPRVSIAKERTDGVKWDDQYHTVRLVRKADSGLIQVYFDDMSKPIMTAEDKTFAKGRVGFGSFDDTIAVDDIRIWGKKVENGAQAPKQGK
jgi:hypothetical protein